MTKYSSLTRTALKPKYRLRIIFGWNTVLEIELRRKFKRFYHSSTVFNLLGSRNRKMNVYIYTDKILHTISECSGTTIATEWFF